MLGYALDSHPLMAIRMVAAQRYARQHMLCALMNTVLSQDDNSAVHTLFERALE